MSNIITSDIDCENMNHMIDLEIEAVKLSNIVKFIQKKLFSFIQKRVFYKLIEQLFQMIVMMILNIFLRGKVRIAFVQKLFFIFGAQFLLLNL